MPRTRTRARPSAEARAAIFAALVQADADRARKSPDDWLLIGAAEIGAALGITERRAFDWLEKGWIAPAFRPLGPDGKPAGPWQASRRAVRESRGMAWV